MKAALAPDLSDYTFTSDLTQAGTLRGFYNVCRHRAGPVASGKVQQEDIEICETVQKGLQSRSYDVGRFSVQRENGAHHFHSLVYHYLSQSTPRR